MIDLHDIRYVRLGTRDLEGAARYARAVLGLQEIRREAGCVYFRSDLRDHSVCYFEGDPTDQTVAFDIADDAGFEAAATQLDAMKVDLRRGTRAEAEQRRAADFLSFRDPTGNRIELVLRAAQTSRPLHGGRHAGIESFSHVGLCTTDAKRDEAFWTQVCNARVSDRVGDAPLLRIDQVHHKIALFPTHRAGIQHVNFQVDGIDDVMRSYYFLKEQGIPIRFGPGRHPTSSAMFLYFAGPDNMIYEYSTGVRKIAPEDEADYVPRQFPFDATGFCMWGSRPDIPEFPK